MSNLLYKIKHILFGDPSERSGKLLKMMEIRHQEEMERKSLSNPHHFDGGKHIERNQKQISIRDGAAIRKILERSRVAKLFEQTSEMLDGLSPKEFEAFVCNRFRELNYQVHQTPYSNDGGLDAIMIKDEARFSLECKKYQTSNSVGRPDIQKFHSAMLNHNCSIGFFVTTSRFTHTARAYAADKNIKLIDFATIHEFLNLGDLSAIDGTIDLLCPRCGKEHKILIDCTLVGSSKCS